MKTYYLIGVLALLLLVGCASDRTVSTQGTATLTVDPDEARVVIVVENIEKSAAEARDATSATVESIQTALAAHDVETQYFNVQERFDWTEDGRKSLGFAATHALEVTTEDFDTLGDIIDASIDNGATSIGSVQFDMSEERKSTLKQEAIVGAGKDARLKAEALAEGIGARLGKVQSVSDVQYNYAPYMRYETMDAAVAEEAAKTSIQPRSLDVVATVNVVYSIK